MFRRKPKPTYQEYSNQQYSELSTVESMRNEILPEEFPDGPYGAATHEVKLGKATGWEDQQHRVSNLAYEYRNFHQNLPRHEPASHPVHDDPTLNEEPR